MDQHELLALDAAKKEKNVTRLFESLRDPEHRFLAAKYLGELGVQEAIPDLIRLLRGGDAATRSSAAEALGMLDARTATPDLVELARHDELVVPRTFAITALGSLGDARAVEPLSELLSDENILIRQSAARALGALGDDTAIEALRAAAARERWYSRGLHKKAIRRIRERSGRPASR